MLEIKGVARIDAHIYVEDQDGNIYRSKVVDGRLKWNDEVDEAIRDELTQKTEKWLTDTCELF